MILLFPTSIILHFLQKNRTTKNISFYKRELSRINFDMTQYNLRKHPTHYFSIKKFKYIHNPIAAQVKFSNKCIIQSTKRRRAIYWICLLTLCVYIPSVRRRFIRRRRPPPAQVIEPPIVIFGYVFVFCSFLLYTYYIWIASYDLVIIIMLIVNTWQWSCLNMYLLFLLVYGAWAFCV